jgi:hypothetical protein
MEQLEQKLKEIEALLKGAPQIVSPKPPKLPTPVAPIKAPEVAAPSNAPASGKNPVKAAQQIQDPSVKKVAVKQAKSLVKFDKNGQWSIC